MDSQHATGTAIGGLLGFCKAIVSIKFFGLLSWSLAFETLILASIGAVAGFLITELLKWLKKKIVE